MTQGSFQLQNFANLGISQWLAEIGYLRCLMNNLKSVFIYCYLTKLPHDKHSLFSVSVGQEFCSNLAGWSLRGVLAIKLLAGAASSNGETGAGGAISRMASSYGCSREASASLHEASPQCCLSILTVWLLASLSPSK